MLKVLPGIEIPAAKQISNYVFSQKRRREADLIYTFGDLEYCIFYCKERSIYNYSIEEYNQLPLDQTLFLAREGGKVASYTRKSDKQKISGLSAIFASRSELRTAAMFFMEHAKGKKVAGSCDFTFGYVTETALLSPSYAHCLLGSRSLRRVSVDGRISQWLRPFCRNISPSECGESFLYLAESLREVLILFEGVPRDYIYFDSYNSDHAGKFFLLLLPSSVVLTVTLFLLLTINHSDGVINAAKIAFQNPAADSSRMITTLDWTHISRNSISGQRVNIVNPR